MYPIAEAEYHRLLEASPDAFFLEAKSLILLASKASAILERREKRLYEAPSKEGEYWGARSARYDFDFIDPWDFDIEHPAFDVPSADKNYLRERISVLVEGSEFTTSCNSCHGSGKLAENCSNCNGKGSIETEVRCYISVECCSGCSRCGIRGSYDELKITTQTELCTSCDGSGECWFECNRCNGCGWLDFCTFIDVLYTMDHSPMASLTNIPVHLENTVITAEREMQAAEFYIRDCVDDDMDPEEVKQTAVLNYQSFLSTRETDARIIDSWYDYYRIRLAAIKYECKGYYYIAYYSADNKTMHCLRSVQDWKTLVTIQQ